MADTAVIPFFKADAAFPLEYSAVKHSGTADEVSLCTAVTDVCIGFTTAKPAASGAKVQLVSGGLALVIADGAIAEGEAFVPSDNVDGAVEALGTTGGKVCGYALNALADTEQGYAVLDCVRPSIEDALDYGISAGAEAANVISVTFTGPPGVRTFKLQVFEATMIEALAAAFTMAETGTGAEVSTTANATLIITTAADGAAVVGVTDVPGASGKTVYLQVTPLGDLGPIKYLALTFD